MEISISTHTPLAGRDKKIGWNEYQVTISTHTPLAGRDYHFLHDLMLFGKFLLTRPSRDVTKKIGWNEYQVTISTHTPLAGRDQNGQEIYKNQADFYSHAPRGT